MTTWYHRWGVKLGVTCLNGLMCFSSFTCQFLILHAECYHGNGLNCQHTDKDLNEIRDMQNHREDSEHMRMKCGYLAFAFPSVNCKPVGCFAWERHDHSHVSQDWCKHFRWTSLPPFSPQQDGQSGNFYPQWGSAAHSMTPPHNQKSVPLINSFFPHKDLFR